MIFFTQMIQTAKLSEEVASTKIYEINSAILKLLKSQIEKIQSLMRFTINAIDVIGGAVASIAHILSNESTSGFVSFHGKYVSIMRLLDVMFKLDNMKDMRSVLKDDFFRYEKTLETRSDCIDPSLLRDMAEVKLFLTGKDAQKSTNYILLTIRDRLKPILSYEKVIGNILDLSLSNFETGLFATSDEKFGLIRLMPHLMVLLDGDGNDPKSANVFKRQNASSFQKVFQRYHTVPLFGDMCISLHSVLERAQHFNKATFGDLWGSNTPTTSGVENHPDYDIKIHWAEIRGEYTRYVVSFSAFMNQLSRSNSGAYRQNVQSNSIFGKAILASAKSAFELIKRGFLLLAHWNSQIQLTMVWKSTYSKSSGSNNNALRSVRTQNVMFSEGAEDVKENQSDYSDEELSVLGDIISLSRSLSSLLSKAHTQLAPLIRVHQHHRIQVVTRSDMIPLAHRVDKRKKMDLLTPLLSIISLAADNDGDSDVGTSYKHYSRKQGQVEIAHKIRNTAASASILYLLRSKLHAIYDDRSIYRQKSSLLGKTDLEKEDIIRFEEFYEESFFYPYLLNFEGTLREISSMWTLWYREHNLELINGVQFPIEKSLPWLLTRRIIAVHTAPSCCGDSHLPIKENLSYMLDIYNDAAYQALHVLHEQHLFDEIEAEANLVLDQILNTLSEDAYSSFKNFSASCMLEPAYKKKLEDLNTQRFLTVGEEHFQVIMRQREIQLLGRSIDICTPFVNLIKHKIREDVDTAISRFEENDACSIIEVQILLDVIRITLRDLTRVFDLNTDFSSIFGVVNESLESPYGRIMERLLASIDFDIVSNFSYNIGTGRFVRSIPGKKTKATPQEMGNVSNAYGSVCYKAYEAHGRATRYFFGKIHADAILSLTGCSADRTGVLLISERCLTALSDRLHDAHDYIGVLRQGVTTCKFPSFTQHAFRCIDHFEVSFKELLEYEGLKPELFQVFREIGNIMMLLKTLSDSISTSFATAGNSTSDGCMSHPMDLVQDNNDFPTLAHAASLLPPDGNKSLFHHTLKHFEVVLRKDNLFKSWTEEISPDKDESSSADLNSDEFHFTWSVLSFLSCLSHTSNSQHSDSVRFGDGFTASGIFILHFLGKREVFERNDFGSHLLRVHAHDCRAAAFDSIMSKTCSEMHESSLNLPRIESILSAASDCHTTQQSVFDMLYSVLTTDIHSAAAMPATTGKIIKLYRAPKHRTF